MRSPHKSGSRVNPKRVPSPFPAPQQTQTQTMSRVARRKATEGVRYNLDDDDTPHKASVKNIRGATKSEDKENVIVLVENKKGRKPKAVAANVESDNDDNFVEPEKKTRKPKKTEVAEEESEEEKVAKTKKNAVAKAPTKKTPKVEEPKIKSTQSDSEDELAAITPISKSKPVKPGKKPQDKPRPEDEPDPKDEPVPKGRKRGAAGRGVAHAEDEENAKPAAKKVRTARADPTEEEEVKEGQVEEAPRKVAATKAKRRNRASEEDGEGDAAKLKKELEEVRQALEQLTVKYDNLKNLRITDAERNFQEYKKTAEKRFESADEMIAQLVREKEQSELELKPDTAHGVTSSKQQQAKSVQNDDSKREKEREREKKEWEKARAEKERVMKADVEDLKGQVRLLEKERDAEIENSKSLTARLAKANKPASGAGSGNGKSGAGVDQPLSSSEQQRYREITMLHEDLSGLLVRDIKISSEGKVFDCLETGRNGTLHFKLTQRADSSSMEYHPILDASRDANLIALLPDYMTEDIEFNKEESSMFFWRLQNFLQKPQKD